MLLLLGLGGIGCGSEREPDPGATESVDGPPQPTTSPPIVSLPEPEARGFEDAGMQDGSQARLKPRPPDRQRCRIPAEICEFALELFGLFAGADLGLLMSISKAQEFACDEGRWTQLCENAALGDLRQGYTVSASGEGARVGTAEFREWLSRELSRLAFVAPKEEDGYGGGGLQISSVGCHRGLDQPSGSCGDAWIEVVLSYIDESEPLGFQRAIVCLQVFRPKNEQVFRLTGVGCPIPSTALLYDSERGAATADGVEGWFGVYAWSP